MELGVLFHIKGLSIITENLKVVNAIFPCIILCNNMLYTTSLSYIDKFLAQGIYSHMKDLLLYEWDVYTTHGMLSREVCNKLPYNSAIISKLGMFSSKKKIHIRYVNLLVISFEKKLFGVHRTFL